MEIFALIPSKNLPRNIRQTIFIEFLLIWQSSSFSK